VRRFCAGLLKTATWWCISCTWWIWRCNQ